MSRTSALSWRIAAVLGSVLLIPTAAVAGTLAVNMAGAFEGTNGLQVTIEETCIFPDVALLDSPPQIQGSHGGCDSLTATTVEVVGAGATFEAADFVALGNGFSVASGASLTVQLGPPSSKFAWVTDDSPADEILYGAEYRLRLDSLTLAAGDIVTSLGGFAADGTPHFQVRLTRNVVLGEDRLVLEAREDDGGTVSTAGVGELLLPAGYNLIEIVWAAGAGTGYFRASVNGSIFTGLSRLDNDRARIGSVRWGAVGGVAAATTGGLHQDAFTSY